MGLEVARCTSTEELAQALGGIWHYFGIDLGPSDIERYDRLLGPSRMYAARVNGKVVAGAGAYRHGVTVPGGTVPAAGVTLVGVLPTHRRQGILRAMMRQQLDDLHRDGEALAFLWASEETIYGRFGYGMASLCGEVEIPRTANQFALPATAPGRLELLPVDEAIVPAMEVYDAVRRSTPGMIARSEDWWRLRRFADPPSRRGGGGPMQQAVLWLDEEPAAYALYRVYPSTDAGITSGFVQVIEAIGGSPEATRQIWRFLLDIDWATRVRAGLLPVDHPLFFLLARPRAMRFHAMDALWMRLVDVEAGLNLRHLADNEPVVIEVSDDFCPWNVGRYRLADGVARRTEQGADLACDVTVLGSVLLGGFTFGQLAAGGRILERSPGAVRKADRWFPREVAPWCPEIF